MRKYSKGSIRWYCRRGLPRGTLITEYLKQGNQGYRGVCLRDWPKSISVRVPIGKNDGRRGVRLSKQVVAGSSRAVLSGASEPALLSAAMGVPVSAAQSDLLKACPVGTFARPAAVLLVLIPYSTFQSLSQPVFCLPLPRVLARMGFTVLTACICLSVSHGRSSHDTTMECNQQVAHSFVGVALVWPAIFFPFATIGPTQKYMAVAQEHFTSNGLFVAPPDAACIRKCFEIRSLSTR